jgi:hypothetical protein
MSEGDVETVRTALDAFRLAGLRAGREAHYLRAYSDPNEAVSASKESHADS